MLDNNIQAFESIQDHHLEELSDAETIAAEETDIESERVINETQYGLLIKARNAWDLVDEIKDTIADLVSSSSLINVTGHQRCEQLWKVIARMCEVLRVTQSLAACVMSSIHLSLHFVHTTTRKLKSSKRLLQDHHQY